MLRIAKSSNTEAMIPRDITPTEEQAQKIAEINAWFERAVQPLRDEEQRRMERYYDCQDDYGWGGPSSFITQGEINKLEYQRDRKVEAVIRGGFCLDESKFSRLLTIDGKPVENARLIHSKFGWCWMFGDGESFLSVPKRLKTINDKGYTMELVSRTYRVYDSEGRIELEKEVVETSLQPCTPNRIDIKYGLKVITQTK